MFMLLSACLYCTAHHRFYVVHSNMFLCSIRCLSTGRISSVCHWKDIGKSKSFLSTILLSFLTVSLIVIFLPTGVLICHKQDIVSNCPAITSLDGVFLIRKGVLDVGTYLAIQLLAYHINYFRAETKANCYLLA